MTSPAGADSRGAARKADDDESIPVGAHHGGSFGVYMRHKTERLQRQFHDVEAVQSSLFEGMVFHVNGHTDVPIEELRRQIVLHGGRVEQYATSRVTHILCKHLPHAKIRELTSQKLARGAHQQVPIIQPRFIQECLAAGRRLPHAPFLVDGLRERHGQSLKGFFQRGDSGGGGEGGDGGGAEKGPPSSPPPRGEAKGDEEEQAGGAARRSPPAGDGSNLDTPGGGDTEVDEDEDEGMDVWALDDVDGEDGGSEDGDHRGRMAWRPEQQHKRAGDDTSPAAGATARATTTATSALTSPPQQPQQPSSRPPGAIAVSGSGGGESGGGSGSGSGSKRGRPAWRDGRPPMSTKEDPAFLSRYYETSRLHWIGSFKAKLMQEVGAEAADKFRVAGGAKRPPGGLVLHIDLDCFFVSALVRDRPELRDKPLAVAHADGHGPGGGTGFIQGSSSEISSCNYVARARGVRASMFLGEARRLCPELVVLRYDFGVYEAVARRVYRIFFEEAAVVQPVSCDEAFLELPLHVRTAHDGAAAMARIRGRILAETGCPASAGLSTNPLLARLATKQAKPNGQRALLPAEAPAFLESLPVTELPGVGWRLGRELEARGVATCGQLQRHALAELQGWVGEKTGRLLWERCRGQDPRRVAPELGGPKSLGAEVNWGVRFDEQAQVERFVGELAEEVERRLRRARVRGRQVVVKVKRSQYGPVEPEKLLGCGRCDNLSRSLTLPRATARADEIAAAALQLYRPLRVAPNLLRGIGIQMMKLEAEQGAAAADSPGAKDGKLAAWLTKQPPPPQQPQAQGSGGDSGGGRATAIAAATTASDAAAGSTAQQLHLEQEGGDGDEEEEEGDDEDDDGGYGSGWEPVTPSPSRKKARATVRSPPAAAAAAATAAAAAADEEGEVEVLEVTPPPKPQRRGRTAHATAASASAAASAAAALAPEHWLLSLSQLDEEVLAGLPPDVQREVREAARPSAAVSAPVGGPPSHRQGQGAGVVGTGAIPAPPPPPPPPPRGRGPRQLRVDAYDVRALQAEGADAEHLAALPPLVRVELNEQFLRGGRRLPAPELIVQQQQQQQQQQAAAWMASASASASASPGLARGGAAASSGSSPSPATRTSARKAAGGKRPLQRQGSLQRQRQQQQQQQRHQHGAIPPPHEVIVMDGAADTGDAAGGALGSPSQEQQQPARLFAVEDVGEVRRALRRWFESIASPQPQDLEMLVTYLMELLEDGRADDAWALMRALRRWTMEEATKQQAQAVASAWRKGYHVVLSKLTAWLETNETGSRPGRLRWAGLELD